MNKEASIGLINLSQCYDCANYLPDDTTIKQQCTAYNEIPDIIFSNLHDHREEYEGDKGVTFTPASAEAGICNSKRWKGISPEWLKMHIEIQKMHKR